MNGGGVAAKRRKARGIVAEPPARREAAARVMERIARRKWERSSHEAARPIVLLFSV
jgi:hypothetical protein